MRFTIFGSTGYLGSSLIEKFKADNIEYVAPDLRNKKNLEENLGHVIYAIGVPNFKEFPSKAIDAHVILLNKLLNETNFESFLYLSSTRIYHNATSTDERADLLVNPLDENNLYNISKIMGEGICNASKKSNVRIVRLSNVTGKNFNSHLFLPSIIQESLKSKKITLQTNLESEKDYVYIDDVMDILPKISLHGNDSTYNVASGKNITNEQIVKELQRITGCEVEVAKNAKKYSFPTISIEKIRNEFNFKPTSILNKFNEIVNEYKK